MLLDFESDLKNKNGCFLFQFQKYEIEKRAAGPNQFYYFICRVWDTRFDSQLKKTRKKHLQAKQTTCLH